MNSWLLIHTDNIGLNERLTKPQYVTSRATPTIICSKALLTLDFYQTQVKGWSKAMATKDKRITSDSLRWVAN